MSADTLHYEFIQAGELRFEVATAGDPASRKLALLLHGFPECAFSWRHQLPFLAARGYRVWAPNQRGYGNSPMPRGVKSYRIEELVNDVARLIDASGVQQVHLAGHDWGALVAWEFALRRPRPIERLAIFNVPHPARFREEIRHNKVQRRRSRYVASWAKATSSSGTSTRRTSSSRWRWCPPSAAEIFCTRRASAATTTSVMQT